MSKLTQRIASLLASARVTAPNATATPADAQRQYAPPAPHETARTTAPFRVARD